MPILIWVHRTEQGISSIIGVCAYHERDTFEGKVRKLCDAMGWHFEEIHTFHAYNGSIIDNFPVA